MTLSACGAVWAIVVRVRATRVRRHRYLHTVNTRTANKNNLLLHAAEGYPNQAVGSGARVCQSRLGVVNETQEYDKQ